MKRRSVKKKSRVRNRDCAWHVITTTWSRSARIDIQTDRTRLFQRHARCERGDFHKAEPGGVAKA